MLYFSPEIMCKNHKLNQKNNPLVDFSCPKTEFGIPDCPVRALWYNHFMKGHPELWKGRSERLFISIKDNNSGKELRAATIPATICNTIVEAHAALHDSKSLPKTLKHRYMLNHLLTTIFKGTPADCIDSRQMDEQGNIYFVLLLSLLSPSGLTTQDGPLLAGGRLAVVNSSS